jgi:hypothetical protein
MKGRTKRMRAALAASLLLTAALPAAAQAPRPAALPGSVESPQSLDFEAAAVDGGLSFADRVEGAPDRGEATFGGEGEGVLFEVMRAHHVGVPHPERPQPVRLRRQRAAELADSIAPRVDALRRDFAHRVQGLDERAGPGRPLPTPAVLALLDELENELRDALAATELLPVLAWFLDLLDQARTDLTGSPPSAVEARLAAGPPAPGGLVFAVLPIPQESPRDPPAPSPGSAPDWLARIGGELDRLFTRADTRQLTQDLCVRSLPRPSALVALWPWALSRQGRTPDVDIFERETNNPLSVFYRGLYAYRAMLEGESTLDCTADGTTCARVDLWKDNGPFLVCNFRPSTGRCLLGRGDLARCRR